MNILNFNPKAKSVKFSEALMWVELHDGRTIGAPLVYFPRLSSATLDQLNKYEISGCGIGIHWDELNEDISVKALLSGNSDLTAQSKDAA